MKRIPPRAWAVFYAFVGLGLVATALEATESLPILLSALFFGACAIGRSLYWWNS